MRLPEKPQDDTAAAEPLARTEAELLERIESLEADVALYRSLAETSLRAVDFIRADRDALLAELGRA